MGPEPPNRISPIAQSEVVKNAQSPHRSDQRILAHKVYVEEVERLVGKYNQHGEHGDLYAMDGKARRGMRKKDEEGQEYGLSIYDVQQAKVMAQVEVGCKENEIVKAPKALKLVEIS